MSVKAAALPTPNFYKFKVRRPLDGAADTKTFIFTTVGAYGINEDDAVKEVLEGYPDAVEVLPVKWGGRKPSPTPEILCARPEGTGGFCHWCGIDPARHPVTSDMPESSEARKWLESLYREGIYGGEQWD